MQIDLILKNKILTFAEGSATEWLISDNADYQLHIDILDERKNAMFAVFVRDGQAVQCTIDNDGYVLNTDGERGVPMWALGCPYIDVGVVTDDYATFPFAITVKGSIKRLYDEEIVKPDNPLVEQLIAIVNKIRTEGAGLPDAEGFPDGQIVTTKDGHWIITTPTTGSNITVDETLTLEGNRLSVNTTNTVEEDNTLPITAAGVYSLAGNINALLATI